jgi:hypothetical protein
LSHSPFFNINTKDDKDRNKEFENAMGNLLVAEYQVYRLRERIKNFLASDGVRVSDFMFKVGDEWFRVSISAQKQSAEGGQEEDEKDLTPTTGFALPSNDFTDELPPSSEAEEEYLP